MNSFPLDIRILPVENILPFEDVQIDHDKKHTPDPQDVVRDPFPVTRLSDRDFLLVDDVERFHLLTAAGLSVLPVQLCPAGELTITSTPLAVSGYSRSALMSLAARCEDEILVDADPNHPLTNDETADAPPGYLPVTVRFGGESRTGVLVRMDERNGFPAALRLLFEDIEVHGSYRPLFDTHHDSASLLKDPGVDCTLLLPPFQLSDLGTAAQSQSLFPADLVRIGYANRVIAVDFPISVLTADISIEEKQSFLEDLVSLRRRSRRTSLVEGRVFILNR